MNPKVIIITAMLTVIGTSFGAWAVDELKEIAAAKDVAAANAEAIQDLTENTKEFTDALQGYIQSNEGRVGRLEGQVEVLTP